MLIKRRTPDSKAPASPLELKKRALAEEEAKIAKEIAHRQKLLEDAPKIAEKQARERREQTNWRRSHTTIRPASPATLTDFRHQLNVSAVTPAARRQSLRCERQQGRLMFFVLLLVLAAVAYWLYLTVTHP